MPKVNPHADPTRRDLGPAALGRTVKKLFSYYPVLAPVTFVCILFSSIVSSVPSLFTQNIIQIIEKWYISRDWAAAKAEIVPYLTLLVVLYALSILSMTVYTQFMAYMTQGFLHKLRCEMFGGMQKLPIRYFDSHQHGDIMSHYTNDIDTLRQLVSQSLPQLFASGLTVLGLLLFMLYFSIPLMLIVFLGIFFMTQATKNIGGKSAKYFLNQQRSLGKVEGYIEEMMNGINQAMIDVRGVKQAIWKREMDRRPDIRIKYASKYDESSNYWKNSIGTNKAIQHLKVLEKKRAAEAALREWIQAHPEEREKLIRLFSSLELNYGNRREINRALAYFGEAFINGPELVQLALEILNFDFEAEEKQVVSRMKKLLEKYDNLDTAIDKEVFAAMDILKAIGLKNDSPYLIACPTCGRTRIDLIGLATRVEEMVADIDLDVKVAVMGWVVNGPGEAREADIGIAGGDGEGLLFKKGQILRKVPEDQLLTELMKEIDKL